MKRLILMLIVAVAFAANADAQGWLKKLGEKAVDAGKRAVERKVENKADRVASDASDAVLDGKKSKKSKSSNSSDSDYEDEEVGDGDDTPDADTQNQKSDFVRGSVILFEDNMDGEQLGEFPSKWDVDEGNAEVASINGKKYMNFTTDYNYVKPLMKDMKSYLPDVFTLEWDMFLSKVGDFGEIDFEMIFMKKGSWNDRAGWVTLRYRPQNPDAWGSYRFEKGNGAEGESTGQYEWSQIKKYIKIGQWNHFAASFNKRAFKFYINGNRVVNIPNAKAPETLLVWHGGKYKYRGITNVVLAAGAKDLYERQTTDLSAAAVAVEKAIAETGKFVTNNILFETGKATLKPESMEEIQKVAEYMKKNPTVRFEVQGHTDNQGSDAVNDPLSQQRAEAVVKALEGLGVDGFNLRAVGKGSHEPVADNTSDAGRAKNRRVEFIKK